MRVVLLCSDFPGQHCHLARLLVGFGVEPLATDPLIIIIDDDVEAAIRAVLPVDLALVFGSKAQRIYSPGWFGKARVLELPDPEIRWTDQNVAFASRIIQEGSHDLSLEFRRGRLVATQLVPF